MLAISHVCCGLASSYEVCTWVIRDIPLAVFWQATDNGALRDMERQNREVTELLYLKQTQLEKVSRAQKGTLPIIQL